MLCASPCWASQMFKEGSSSLPGDPSPLYRAGNEGPECPGNLPSVRCRGVDVAFKLGAVWFLGSALGSAPVSCRAKPLSFAGDSGHLGPPARYSLWPLRPPQPFLGRPAKQSLALEGVNSPAWVPRCPLLYFHPCVFLKRCR